MDDLAGGPFKCDFFWENRGLSPIIQADGEPEVVFFNRGDR
jgi:hypothetical protein